MWAEQKGSVAALTTALVSYYYYCTALTHHKSASCKLTSRKFATAGRSRDETFGVEMSFQRRLENV